MDEKIRNTFSHITMDEEHAEQIKANLSAPHKKASPVGKFIKITATVAACLVLALFVMGNGNIAKAVDNIVYYCEKALKNMRITDMEQQYIFGNGLDAVGYQKVTRPDGSEYYFSAGVAANPWGPYWLKFDYEQSSVHFIGDGSGEPVEITDKISETKIFTAKFTDDYGITHYVAANGVFDNGHLPGYSMNWLEFYIIDYLNTPDDPTDDDWYLYDNGRYNEEDGSINEWYVEAITLLDLRKITESYGRAMFSDEWWDLSETP